MIVKEGSSCYSNYRGQQTISNYLIKNKIVGIQGIDTRKLTQVVRDEGYMNVIISDELSLGSMKKKLLEHHNIEGENFAQFVSTKNKYDLKSKQCNQKIAVIDFGPSNNNALVKLPKPGPISKMS